MNRHAMLACAGIGLLMGCATAGPGSVPDEWEAQVRAAEAHHRAAFLEGNAEAIDAMIAEDFVVNSPQDRVIDKPALMEIVRSGALATSSFEQTIEAIRRLGDVVVVMGEDRIEYVAPSRQAGQVHRRRFTDVWAQRGGAWVLVARHATIIEP